MSHKQQRLSLLLFGRIKMKSAVFALIALIPFNSYGIIGGVEVSDSDSIAQTAAQVWCINPKNRKQFAECSGIVIAKDLVVTAAHCTFLDAKSSDSPLGLKDMFVYLGKFDAKKGFQKNFLYKIASYKVHPEYEGSASGNDVAILKLQRELPDELRPIAFLPSDENLHEQEKVVVAGFGFRKFNKQDFSPPLQKYEKYRVASLPENSSRITVRGAWGKGSYQGDSGGPAFVIRDQRLLLWGVFSEYFADSNGLVGLSSYDDLRQSKDWINATASELGSSFRLD